MPPSIFILLPGSDCLVVRRHVNGHSIYVLPEIRAVICIEAAEKYLLRLASALVLGDDNAGDDPQNFL